MGPYLENRCPWSENKLNFKPPGEKDSPYATSGTFFKFQVSGPDRKF